jgi:uncharacterized glyoxalase superfamily protein PhnB
MTSNLPISDGAAERAEFESLHASMLSVSVTVKDLGKSLAWYHDILGFTIDRKIERDGKLRSVALKAGVARLSINQDDGNKGWDRIKGEGFSLNITTDQNIDKIANRIKELGGTLESEPADMPWGLRLFRLKDPDGFKLTISSPRAAQAL